MNSKKYFKKPEIWRIFPVFIYYLKVKLNYLKFLSIGTKIHLIVIFFLAQSVLCADVLRAQGRPPVLLQGVCQHAAQRRPPWGIWSAPQRRHPVPDPGDQDVVQHAAVSTAPDLCCQRGRESRGQGMCHSYYMCWVESCEDKARIRFKLSVFPVLSIYITEKNI